MFDNPKKELERLQEQLLAVEDKQPDDTFDSPDQDFLSRSAGFDAEIDAYEMDADRYVPAPRKKGIKGRLFIVFLVLIGAGLLISRWMGWLV